MSRYDAWKLDEPDDYDPDPDGELDPDRLRDERWDEPETSAFHGVDPPQHLS